jgi:hypothetical protein
MTVPRSWSKLPKQDPSQQYTVANHVATDGRFKVGAIFLCLAWLVIIYYGRHALHYYKPHSRGIGTITNAIRNLPLRYPLSLLAFMVYLGYNVASSWIFDISIMKYDVNVLFPFLLGYLPCLLILAIFNFFGIIEKNEDKLLIQQRIDRGRAADASLGLTYKPSWWSKARGDSHLDDLQRLRQHIDSEAPPPSDNKEAIAAAVRRGDFELQSVHTTASNPFDDANAARSRSVSRTRDIGGDVSAAHNEPRDGLLSAGDRSGQPWINRTPSNTSMSSALTGNTLRDAALNQRQGQTIRSMLDI